MTIHVAYPSCDLSISYPLEQLLQYHSPWGISVSLMPAHEKWYHLMAHVLLSQPIMFSSSFLLPQGHRVSSSDSSDSMEITDHIRKNKLKL